MGVQRVQGSRGYGVPEVMEVQRVWGIGSQSSLQQHGHIAQLSPWQPAVHGWQHCVYMPLFLNCVLLMWPQDLHKDFSNYIEMVEATVDMNLKDNHDYVIKPSFDEGLTGKGKLQLYKYCCSCWSIKVKQIQQDLYPSYLTKSCKRMFLWLI